MKSRRGEDHMMVIVTIAIALLVLVIVGVILANQFDNRDELVPCAVEFGTCASTCTSGQVESTTGVCSEGQVCCVSPVFAQDS